MAGKSNESDAETPSDEGDGKPVKIRKYPNRRLYNTATSTYIVLKDVIDLVRDGVDFVIEDAKTGEDITRSILNQVIFEQETKPDDYHFPLEFQKQLISMYGDTYGAMVPDYLTESLKLFASERSKVAQAVETAVGRNAKAMMKYSQALAKQNMEMFRRSWDMFGMMTGSKSTHDDGPDDEPEKQLSREEELAEIQSKIDALQERLKALK